jgi:LDH2 family malate/lactate/ureidoglycolate dehydrogenase
VAEFKAQAAAFVTQLKATPCAPGIEEILLPGESEWRTKAIREREGIPLPEVTWSRIAQAANSVSLKLT